MNKIAELNDKCRQQMFTNGHNKIVMTVGVSALPLVEQMCIIKKIRTFNNFNRGNDPYNEHDFGRIEYNGVNYFFKIDYYDTSMECASENPADENLTIRVLTIMRADEY